MVGLTDGRRFPVPHPEFCAIGRNVVVVIDQNDDAITIDPLHIVSIDEKFSKKME